MSSLLKSIEVHNAPRNPWHVVTLKTLTSQFHDDGRPLFHRRNLYFRFGPSFEAPDSLPHRYLKRGSRNGLVLDLDTVVLPFQRKTPCAHMRMCRLLILRPACLPPGRQSKKQQVEYCREYTHCPVLSFANATVNGWDVRPKAARSEVPCCRNIAAEGIRQRVAMPKDARSTAIISCHSGQFASTVFRKCSDNTDKVDCMTAGRSSRYSRKK